MWGWNLSLLTSFTCLMYVQNSSFLSLHSNLLQFSKNAITFPLCLLSRLNAIYFSSPPWNSFLELSEFLFSFLPPSPLQLAALFYMRYTTLNCMPAEMS